MRLLIVSGSSSEDPLGARALAERLEAEGAVDAVLLPVAPSEGAGSAGWGAKRALRAVREAAARRPDAALVFAEPSTYAPALALAALRVPLVLLVPGPEVPRGLGVVARAARAIVTLEPGLPARLHAALGIRGVTVLGGGIVDLADLPLGDRTEARTTIGLEPTQRFLALTGPLEPPLRVDLLALAHRKLAGVGLLVIGTGALDPLVAAMTAATRPSSPVVHVPTLDLEARRIAIQAADAVLALHPEALTEDVALGAACGRVVVGFDHPGLDPIEAAYAGTRSVVRVAEPSAEALRGGLEVALALAAKPMSPDVVLAARGILGRGRPVDQLREVVARCVSSS